MPDEPRAPDPIAEEQLTVPLLKTDVPIKCTTLQPAQTNSCLAAICAGQLTGRSRIIFCNAIETREFYIHESMHRESNLIIVQQDAIYSVYYISAGSSTCFGC